jgi:hypothetical protein
MSLKGRQAAAVLGAASLITPLVMLATAESANAVTVPNQYLCSRWTDKCVQVNGKHVNGLPNACQWSWNIYTSGSPTSVCSYWE